VTSLPRHSRAKFTHKPRCDSRHCTTNSRLFYGFLIIREQTRDKRLCIPPSIIGSGYGTHHVFASIPLDIWEPTSRASCRRLEDVSKNNGSQWEKEPIRAKTSKTLSLGSKTYQWMDWTSSEDMPSPCLRDIFSLELCRRKSSADKTTLKFQ